MNLKFLFPTLVLSAILFAATMLTGHPTTAARRLGASMAVRTEVGRGVGQDEEGWAAPTQFGAREELGEDAFEQAFEEGRLLKLADAFDFAEREASAALADIASRT